MTSVRLRLTAVFMLSAGMESDLARGASPTGGLAKKKNKVDAGSEERQGRKKNSRSGFSWENDRRLWSLVGSDRHYTNGIRLTRIYPEGDAPRVVDALAKRIPGLTALSSHGFVLNHGFVFGQNIYTPSDIRVRSLIREDRPYGGWLYLGVVSQAFKVDDDTGTLSQAHSLEIDAGMIGPAALSGETQRLVHCLIDATRPEGWEHQLDNEPALFVEYLGKWKSYERLTGSGRRLVDFVPHAGTALGNVFSLTRVGATLRVGINISDDLGPAGRPPSLERSAAQEATAKAAETPTVARRDDKWEFYVFGTADGRSVLHNVFLDGNTFSSSHRVERRGFVADLEWGASLRFKRVRLTWRQVRRSPEFSLQSNKHVFGSWTIGWDIGS